LTPPTAGNLILKKTLPAIDRYLIFRTKSPGLEAAFPNHNDRKGNAKIAF